MVLASFPVSGIALPMGRSEEPVATADSSPAATFEKLRIESNAALYNLDYTTARSGFQKMTAIAPDHPAGYIYLANNLWLETLNSRRRLMSSVYLGGSFYDQDDEQDKPDPVRDREFNELIKKAIAASAARLQKNPEDVEALYYQASAQGLRAGYNVTVKRSFRRAIGDANQSIILHKRVIKLDPNYADSYLSIGLYEYVIDSLPFLWRTLARFAGLKGSKKNGIAHLEQAVQSGKYAADDARVILMGIYAKEKQTEKSLEIINQLAGKYPKNFLFGLEKGSMLFRLGRHDEGSKVFAEMLKMENVAQVATDLIHFQWAEGLASRNDHAGALEHYNAVAKWTRSSQDLVTLSHLHAGEALDAQGKREEAIAEYQKVLKRENVFNSHKLANQYVAKPFTPAKA